MPVSFYTTYRTFCPHCKAPWAGPMGSQEIGVPFATCPSCRMDVILDSREWEMRDSEYRSSGARNKMRSTVQIISSKVAFDAASVGCMSVGAGLVVPGIMLGIVFLNDLRLFKPAIQAMVGAAAVAGLLVGAGTFYWLYARAKKDLDRP